MKLRLTFHIKLVKFNLWADSIYRFMGRLLSNLVHMPKYGHMVWPVSHCKLPNASPGPNILSAMSIDL